MSDSSVLSQSTQINYTMALRKLQGGYSYTEQNLASLYKAFSIARLSTYMKFANQNQEHALRLYQLNIELGQCLYIVLQTLEVALRNAISQTIEQRFGTDWYEQPRFEVILDKKWAEPELKKAIEKKNNRKNNQLKAGDIISELSFGFWREMLKKKYEKHIWRQNEFNNAFPHVPGSKSRQEVYDNVDAVLKLRNRISHHEPILNNKLELTYRNALDTIGWICTDTKAWVEHHSRFEEVYRVYIEELSDPE